MKDQVVNAVATLLDEKPRYRDLLKRIVGFEESNDYPNNPMSCECGFKTVDVLNALEHNRMDDHYASAYSVSWEWEDVRGGGAELKQLCLAGIVVITSKTRSTTKYRLIDLESTKQGLSLTDPVQKDKTTTSPSKASKDKRLFKAIVGHDDVKEILTDIIESKEQGHALLWGSPATAKTVFLLDIGSYVDGAQYVIGGSTSKAGLSRFLIERSPSVLLIDEIEKMPREEISVLLSLMETGILREMKYGRDTSVHRLNTKVIVAANEIHRLSRELVSRFRPFVFHFRDYTDEELSQVSVGVMTMRGIKKDIAEYIADKMLKLGEKDVRGFVNLAKQANTREKVDRYIRLLKMRREE